MNALVSPEFVDAAGVPVLGEHHGGGIGVVGVRRRADPAVVRCPENGAGLDIGTGHVGVVRHVPAVAEEDVGHAALTDIRLGGFVIGGDHQCGRVGPGRTRVRDQSDLRVGCGIDNVAVLVDPVPDVGAGDEQHLVHAGERGTPGGAIVVVGLPGSHPELSQVGECGVVATESDDVIG